MPKANENENTDALESPLGRGHLFDVAGKVVVISGGGSGIGAMMAAGFVRNGAVVYIFSRKDTSSFAQELTAGGPGTCTALVADAQKPATLERLVSTIQGKEGKVHCLINNAGTNFNAPFAEYPAAAFGKVVDVNLVAVFRLIQLFAPLLRAAATPSSPARVINISSINGISPPANFPTYAYSTSKAAVLMLSRHLAQSLAPDVTVNAIAPGPFRSRMMRGTFKAAGEEALASGTLLQRVGAPGDICGAALFLASEAGAWITGTTITLDGGSLLSPTSSL